VETTCWTTSAGSDVEERLVATDGIVVVLISHSQIKPLGWPVLCAGMHRDKALPAEAGHSAGGVKADGIAEARRVGVIEISHVAGQQPVFHARIGGSQRENQRVVEVGWFPLRG